MCQREIPPFPAGWALESPARTEWGSASRRSNFQFDARLHCFSYRRLKIDSRYYDFNDKSLTRDEIWRRFAVSPTKALIYPSAARRSKSASMELDSTSFAVVWAVEMSPSRVSMLFHAFTESTASKRLAIKELRLSHSDFFLFIVRSSGWCSRATGKIIFNDTIIQFIFAKFNILAMVKLNWWARTRTAEDPRNNERRYNRLIWHANPIYIHSGVRVPKSIHICDSCNAPQTNTLAAALLRGLRRNGIGAKMLIECMSILCIYRAPSKDLRLLPGYDQSLIACSRSCRRSPCRRRRTSCDSEIEFMSFPLSRRCSRRIFPNVTATTDKTLHSCLATARARASTMHSHSSWLQYLLCFACSQQR